MMVDQHILTKARQIRCVITDVDGVLTDGILTYNAEGILTKSFHVQDGYGIKLLQASGVEVCAITACISPITQKRFDHLGIKYAYLGQNKKQDAYEDILTKLSLKNHEVAYIGDDLPDLELIQRSHLGIAVQNANPHVKQLADMITSNRGGNGAMREVCDMILQAQGGINAAFEILHHANDH